jgi:hypothetical protein
LHPEKKTAPEPLVPLMHGSSPKCGAARTREGSAVQPQNPFPEASSRHTPHALGQSLHKYPIFIRSSAAFIGNITNIAPSFPNYYSPVLVKLQESIKSIKKYMIFTFFVLK